MDIQTFAGLAITSGATLMLLKIIAIDIILSGDNAVVIAMATRNLPKRQQNKAIFWGTAGAVILRILFAAIIVYLLKIPYVNVIGGVLLLIIAYKVLVEDEGEANVRASTGIITAIGTIIMADAVMSLDNVVAVAGAADGHIGLIALGVAVSIPIMIFGSKFIVKAMERFAWIAYIGAGILAWTAGEMMMKDKGLTRFLHIEHGPVTSLIAAALTALILVLGFYKNKKNAANKIHKIG